MLIPPNIRIRRIERGTKLDRYGEESLEVVHANVHGCLQRKTEFFRTPNGNTKQIDAMLILPGYLDVHANDIITLDTPRDNKYRVFTEEEDLDPNGQIILRSLRLVKIVQQS